MNLKIELFKNVYQPQTDTYLLLDHTYSKPNDTVLELCTGCGIIALHLAQTARTIDAVDMNPHAVANALHNAKLNGIENISVHNGNLYEPVQGRTFDLIVANPPYVPSPPELDNISPLETAWNGGWNGRRLIDQIIEQARYYLNPDGRLVMVQSSLADIPETYQKLDANGFVVRTCAKKWLPLGPVSRGRYEWLKQNGTLIHRDAELLVVFGANKPAHC